MEEQERGTRERQRYKSMPSFGWRFPSMTLVIGVAAGLVAGNVFKPQRRKVGRRAAVVVFKPA